MHTPRVRTALRLVAAFALASLGLGATPAQAGVPRSCIDDSYDPIACKRDTRRVYREVLPSARLRVLETQRPGLERVIPLEDAERNLLLEERCDEPRDPGPRR
jgi:hypothetical protein